MKQTVKIGERLVGENQPAFIIAEIGINHNGSLELAKKLIAAAVVAGCDGVKFQKRTVDIVYTPEELARPRENPFGNTNGDLKYGLEFGRAEYQEIAAYCKSNNILWFASAWDEASVDFLEQFEPPCYKIASASLTDDNLLKHHRSYQRPIILSTGMSNLEQIDRAVEILGTDNLIIMHCTSTYPSQPAELNLRAISTLKERYGVPIGYSGHETGISASIAAVALGACAIERHITLDRTMWGSDQSASLESQDFIQLVKNIRTVETALGDGVKRVYDSEIPIIKKLRRVGG
ncbi:MAG: N-acetylneuraminate synthase family protein [Xenococcaceae cyanobacterium MO_234.B1]|nr:N-acetylneuraminate synthase family protein [Xenococcaceae cyanobacterium MO_234.B1]